MRAQIRLFTLTTMEASAEMLLGVSLDSVVDKAAELEKLLRDCKHAALDEITSTVATEPLEGRDRLHGDTMNVELNHLASPSTWQPNAEVGLAVHWHRLSTYIVGLEKELHYYRRLVEDGGGQVGFRTVSQPERDAEAAQDPAIVRLRTSESGGGSSKTNEETGLLQRVTHLEHPGLVVSHGKDERGRAVFAADQLFWKKLLKGDNECQWLLAVFSHLTTAELCSVARVSRKWYTVSKHPNLWRRVSISETVITSQTLVTLSQWCSGMEQLSLHGLVPEMASCDEDLQTYLARIKGSLEPGLAAILSVSSQTLVSVAVNECNLMITERIFWLLGIHCPGLQALSYCSDEFPPSSEALWSLAQGCHNLCYLKLPPVHGSPNASVFTDNCLFQLAQVWPTLVSLTIGGSAISAVGLAKVAQCCHQLSHLEVMHGPDFDKDTVQQVFINEGFPSLRVLILNFTAASRAALELLLENSPTLECLQLHITLQLYFPESTDPQPDTFSTYEHIVTNLRKLESHPKGRGIFQLFEHYSGIKTSTNTN